MFPPLLESELKNIVKILMKPEALRDTKTDLLYLNKKILNKWEFLSQTFESLNQHQYGPLSDLDLIELGKVV